MLSWCPLLVVASLELQQNGEPCGRIGFYPKCYVCIVYIECFMFVHRVPLPGMETHIPVIFLNLKRMSHHFQNKIWLTCFSSLQADISILFFLQLMTSVHKTSLRFPRLEVGTLS